MALASEDTPTVIHSSVDDDPGPSSRGIIAVDMDDVLCQTNATIVHMHNRTFNSEPPLSLDDFKNYLYWQNRGWGTPTETVEMVGKLYAQGLYMKSPPVPFAKPALLRLKSMGYSLIIITARSEKQREGTEDWVAKHMPGIFDEIHFTGAFQHLEPTVEETEGQAAKRAIVSHKKRSKAEIVHNTGALFLVDDSAENALDASASSPPVKVLLFGDYPWNAVVYRHGEQDRMTYVEKADKGLLADSEAKRGKALTEGWLPEGVERVSDWDAVVRWTEDFERKR